MKRFNPDFANKLPRIKLAILEKSPQTIYALNQRLELIYLNPYWFTFARENSGEPDITNRFPIGTPLQEIISNEEMLSYYAYHFNAVMESGKVWHHEYECSSSEKERHYWQTTYPLKDGSGVLVVHNLIVETSMKNAIENPAHKSYLQSDQTILQCGNCRRVQRPDQPYIWDRVKDWISVPPKEVKMVICPHCEDFYLRSNN